MGNDDDRLTPFIAIAIIVIIVAVLFILFYSAITEPVQPNLGITKQEIQKGHSLNVN